MADLNEKDLEAQSSDAPKKGKAKEVDAKGAKSKAKKPNIFVRMFKRIGSFTRECISEMKKVTWLSRSETFKSSLVVLVITVALAALIGILDTGLELGVNGLRTLGKFIR